MVSSLERLFRPATESALCKPGSGLSGLGSSWIECSPLLPPTGHNSSCQAASMIASFSLLNVNSQKITSSLNKSVAQQCCLYFCVKYTYSCRVLSGFL